MQGWYVERRSVSLKWKMQGQEEDAMIDDVAAFIDGLRNGSDSLNLVRLDD